MSFARSSGEATAPAHSREAGRPVILPGPLSLSVPPARVARRAPGRTQAPTACRRARSGGERRPPKEPRAPRGLGALVRPRSPRSCTSCPPWCCPSCLICPSCALLAVRIDAPRPELRLLAMSDDAPSCASRNPAPPRRARERGGVLVQHPARGLGVDERRLPDPAGHYEARASPLALLHPRPRPS